MKRWQKLVLILLVLILLSQLPFIYRRYRLGKLHAAIAQINSHEVSPADSLVEYKGVAHVHSFLGGHSAGTFEAILAAAKANNLNFVVMTEHPSRSFDTAALTLKGYHDGVLFINGNEVNTATGDRLLLLPGDEQAATDSERLTQAVLSRRSNGLSFVAYPDEFKSWDTGGYDGIEVYNLYTNAQQINRLAMFFDTLWCYRSYPDLLFANFYARPATSLRKWDELTSQGKKLVAVAGNDAHANVGLSLNDSSGKTLLGFKLDPYERSFRLLRLHVLTYARPPREGGLSEQILLDAIAAGHCFIGFDVWGDSTGFRFSGEADGNRGLMGDEISSTGQVKLKVTVPVAARVVLLRNGAVIQDESGIRQKEYSVSEKGAYRVEVYLPQLPGRVRDEPWIISNPIYVR
jgi:hypothetical protein